MEQMALEATLINKLKREPSDCYDFEPENLPQNVLIKYVLLILFSINKFSPKTVFQDVMDILSDMYELLFEEDMWSGLWQKHAHYRETNVAIAYEQQGFYEQAQVSFVYSRLCLS